MAKVKCLFCNGYFDRQKEPYIQIGRRYAHKSCSEGNQESVTELEEIEDFWAYIKQLYGPTYNYQMINKQAREFIETYKFTWTGMKNALKWFYEINNGDRTKGNDGIGIIPFIYDKAKIYYEQLALTQEKNEQMELRQPIINIRIRSPRTWKRPPQTFDWGDED